MINNMQTHFKGSLLTFNQTTKIIQIDFCKKKNITEQQNYLGRVFIEKKM